MMAAVPAEQEQATLLYALLTSTLSRSAITRSSATAHSLPWVECIEAEASGDRLAGLALEGLRPMVREDFVGVSTCTDLDDTMRSIEDVRALLSEC